jgi:hypothetical protein
MLFLLSFLDLLVEPAKGKGLYSLGVAVLLAPAWSEETTLLRSRSLKRVPYPFLGA